ncbi:Gfo/Idh/MocA family oxidoreductase [Zeaxanthinibacter sp. PT1]|uniref:Gfo/Idh/MocA family protein n=1 Tax=Zeaxanthinibacter TaxID=561554 RepID=UPI00234A061D|nr:Gfo/Idh/MocA family oxidoreductase [Zeaxanthinibacter sp. PT1]MDC6351919.1 Gfo/Idh/MocA family oxidoreductase [Zeaxanthinibacter sp. PT1]
MGANKKQSRKQFLTRLGTGALAVAGAPALLSSSSPAKEIISLSDRRIYSANDMVNLALIGAGGMGLEDTKTALRHQGVVLRAVCDLYDGHLERARSMFGKDLMTTKDYREILAMPDIDAVIVATPDHWHKKISVDAMKAGKHVYCEKPMVHSIDEGHDVIKAQKETGMVFQVGSQGMSSLGNEKARELLAQGAIGDINYAEGFWARRSPTGAWQYTIPEDASPQTVDWDTFIQTTEKRPFDATRFFRWRNYRDYGTGMSGDLFVHLFSSLHFITGSMGPDQIYSSGGLRYWKDGREVPDVLLGVFDYPEVEQHPAFNLSLRCNFVDGTSGTTYLRIVGSEGSMNVEWEKVTLQRNKYQGEEDPFLQAQAERKGADTSRKKMRPQDEVVYMAEEGYKGAHYDHFANWLQAIRGGQSVAEDAIFGYRAAAPALLCNDSYYQDKAMKWDPIKMKLI